ncbi:MAG: hypothetical protein U1E02_11085 [Hydrogenophaga sp.]|nr:hypothetical protein [Hydrogenophaga sp.]
MKFDPKDRATNLKDMITRQQEGLELSDLAIADALGYANPRVIEMIKRGLMKLPMNKAPAATQSAPLMATQTAPPWPR